MLFVVCFFFFKNDIFQGNLPVGISTSQHTWWTRDTDKTRWMKEKTEQWCLICDDTETFTVVNLMEWVRFSIVVVVGTNKQTKKSMQLLVQQGKRVCRKWDGIYYFHQRPTGWLQNGNRWRQIAVCASASRWDSWERCLRWQHSSPFARIATIACLSVPF